MGEFKKASNEFKNQLETEMLNIELEERAKKPPEPSPQILPAEKLFDTVSVPPMESIPRGPLPSAAEPAPVDLLAAENPTDKPSETQPVTPEVPSHNA